jgi:hypothetical protein
MKVAFILVRNDMAHTSPVEALERNPLVSLEGATETILGPCRLMKMILFVSRNPCLRVC